MKYRLLSVLLTFVLAATLIPAACAEQSYSHLFTDTSSSGKTEDTEETLEQFPDNYALYQLIAGHIAFALPQLPEQLEQGANTIFNYRKEYYFTTDDGEYGVTVADIAPLMEQMQAFLADRETEEIDLEVQSVLNYAALIVVKMFNGQFKQIEARKITVGDASYVNVQFTYEYGDLPDVEYLGYALMDGTTMVLAMVTNDERGQAIVSHMRPLSDEALENLTASLTTPCEQAIGQLTVTFPAQVRQGKQADGNIPYWVCFTQNGEIMYAEQFQASFVPDDDTDEAMQKMLSTAVERRIMIGIVGSDLQIASLDTLPDGTVMMAFRFATEFQPYGSCCGRIYRTPDQEHYIIYSFDTDAGRAFVDSAVWNP